MWKTKSLAYNILLITYLLFLGGALLLSRNNMAALYITNLLVIFLLFAYVFANTQKLGIKISYKEGLLIIATAVLILMSLILVQEYYAFLLYLKIIILLLFFKASPLTIEDYIRFLNRTYLLYVIISALFFYNLLPFSIYSRWEHPTMYVDIFFVKYYIFYGMEGGASYIDSYSGLVFLVNVFVNRSKLRERKVLILLSSLLIIYTLKLTPLVALVVTILTYLFVKRKSVFLIEILFSQALILAIIYFVVTKIDPIGADIPFDLLVHYASHSRTMIWEQQIHIMLKEYSIVNYVFGGFDPTVFLVPGYQIWGEETGTFYDNPHNTYLLLFFRLPIVTIIFYFALLTKIYQNYSRRIIVPVLYILLICYTNSTIISLQNPIYIYTLISLLYLKRTDENSLRPSRA